jgi:hypothetical protein
MYKRPKKEGRPSNFHEFWNEEVHHIKNSPKKKTVMFECYNLMYPVEQGAIKFGGWFTRR